ncbi:sugar ABC transporter ATP-binding protein [Capillimicrobium parvum]|uniref:Fructose import ATP-binding protein FruK n=1 Tax=Capillimicrobium parvum TaxID=2884022 RepID=A0A9E7C131_9ACTN|nr:sugar ABC transporter ATP-binding protein [Capillimicrobium parvum]UGS36162.1 Fructose import ATP-binding protein FruK [Capillimicrobium parvum]
MAQETTAVPAAPTALRVTDASKSFGATRALRGASIELTAGEALCIVGENGSGKSTLVKLLAGVHRPDAGSLQVGDRTVVALSSPRESIDHGIATVFQEVLVVEARSVLENVWLGTEGLVRAPRSKAAKREKAEAVLDRLLGRSLDLDVPVERLSLSDRQACGIARALVRDPRVLILDEATSALDVATRDRLFEVLRERAADGVAVIFISHRMDEVEEIGDRITVMRSGETVATLRRGETPVAQLVRLMTGAEELTDHAGERADRKIGDVVLHVGDFAVRAGELVGLAGLEGHGQDGFLRALAAAAGDGGAYVPRERRAESLFESKSILENFALPTLARDTAAGVLQPKRSRARLAAFVESLGIKLGRPEDLITTLSGGNQQKVVVARWLATEPAVLLLNDPTRGVDLGAKRDLYRVLVDLAASGMAIVMLSTEVDEHIELMDRVVVFREGGPFCEIPRDGLSRQALVGAFFGQRPEVTHA